MCNAGAAKPSPPLAAAPVAPAVVACSLASSELMLLDEIGLPLAGLAVVIRLASGAVINATSAADGRICLNQPPGTAGQIELAGMHEGQQGDSSNTASGHHFAAGGTGP